MRKALLICMLFLLSCKNKSTENQSSSNNWSEENTLIGSLKDTGFKIKKIQYEEGITLHVVYKVLNEGEYFTNNFSSELNIKLIENVDSIIMDTLLNAGSIYSEIILDDDPVKNKGRFILFEYRICQDGDDGCLNKEIELKKI